MPLRFSSALTHVESGGHILELANHMLEIGDLARFLVRLEPLER